MRVSDGLELISEIYIWMKLWECEGDKKRRNKDWLEKKKEEKMYHLRKHEKEEKNKTNIKYEKEKRLKDIKNKKEEKKIISRKKRIKNEYTRTTQWMKK